MEISSATDMNVAAITIASGIEAAPRPAEPSRSRQMSGNASVSHKEIKQIVEQMQSQLDSMNVSLQYSFYGSHDEKVAVQVVNKETGEVIREIPPKEMQALQTKMSELVGMIFNGEA